ncbi:hypothetical protein C0J52_26903 [Blattella germanica]|nr:hypothetical protein C0J52_26903 [Blattella germanica]
MKRGGLPARCKSWSSAASLPPAVPSDQRYSYRLQMFHRLCTNVYEYSPRFLSLPREIQSQHVVYDGCTYRHHFKTFLLLCYLSEEIETLHIHAVNFE